MANFVALVDPDAARRAAFLDAVASRVAPVDGLRTTRMEAGAFGLVWAASPTAPVSTWAAGTGAAALWGHALRRDAAARLTAAEIAASWADGTRPPEAFDGFHAILTYAERTGLVMGTDVLGLFPAYYAAAGEVFVAGSSPELFRTHPAFPVTLDPVGAVGVLLTQGPFDGRTLLAGVSRLKPAHALRWTPTGGPEEVLQYTIAHAAAADAGSFDADVARFEAVHDLAVARQAPPDAPVGLLLSGGRDSRLLAGFLADHRNDVTALTLGIRSDYEVRCAKAVAKRLGFRHRVASMDDDAILDGATRQATWEHLASGFGSVHMWGAIEPLRALPPTFVSGYLRETREIAPLPRTFDEYFAWDCRHAIPPERLRALLRPGTVRDAVDEVLEGIRATFVEGYPDDSQRAWRYFLSHYARTHAGAVPWRLSFGSWPVLPVLDRATLDLTAALPIESLARRRLQDRILVTRFRHLAQLPLDRNTHNTEPLVPGVRHRLARQRRRLAAAMERRGIPVPAPRRERRYYHRMYDFNRPGWRAVRRGAEPGREQLASWFDMDALAAYLPPPDTTVAFDEPILDGFGPKLLTGLMLWCRGHLS